GAGGRADRGDASPGYELTVLAFFQLDPGDITRSGARDEARRELRKAVYHANDESPVLRALRWALRELSELVDKLVRIAPGGAPSLIVVIVLLVAVVVAIRLGLGPARLRDALTD